jgi:Protein of unknown function (DUF3617)
MVRKVCGGKVCGSMGSALLLLSVCATCAVAAELPTRKAGLWEMKMTASNGQIVQMQQCTDATTDQAMQARSGTGPHGDCSKRDVQRSGATTTIDSTCTMAGKTLTSHVVVTGSFDSDYTMTVTSQGDAVPAGRTTTISAKWLGPCAAGQQPGDMIMPNGMKMNIASPPAMPKGMMPPGAAGAAPGH